MRDASTCPIPITPSLPRKREPRSQMFASQAKQNHATPIAKVSNPNHCGGPSSRLRGEERKGASPRKGSFI
jgi:hypothetical protein